MLFRHTPAIPRTVLLGFVLAAALPAQETSPPLGIHVVRENDTLRGISEYYLGTQERWSEIWQLNKDAVPDPDRIYPGQKLRLTVPKRLPSQSALVTALARRVEDKRAPLPFEPARRFDFLQPLDILQTYEAASAEIRFFDETDLIVTEHSRIILGEEPQAAVPVDRQQIEIEVGQADLESRSPADSPVEIEIVMGDAVVTPRPEAAGERVRTRTRRPEGRGAQLMVYQGASGIAAAGEELKVAQGMGTTVAEGGRPAPPEKLLAAPQIVGPAAGSSWDFPNPAFEWQPVAGAQTYTLEICRDARCGELERRVTGLEATNWQGDALPVAGFFWRVTATSSSGLDGYPSPPAAFTIASDQIASDSAPPRAEVRFIGPQVGVNDRLVLGIGAEILADVTDDGTGVAEWSRLLDGEETAEEGWRGPWSAGSHTAAVTAVDRAGNRMTPEPAAFVYDPDPPVISWGLEDGEQLGEASGEMPPEVNPLTEKTEFGFWSRTASANLSPLVWTSSKIKWLPMEFGDWKISSDKPYIIIRARRRAVELPGIGESVTKNRGVWIHATDPGCGVESMRYQLFIGPQKEMALAIEAVDALDNKSSIVWLLERD